MTCPFCKRTMTEESRKTSCSCGFAIEIEDVQDLTQEQLDLIKNGDFVPFE